ncbi:hypothetical protein F4782DRAFT_485603 [Xylaria castorea]|nr:hypothetical protein F4782DRAFT_485603 [Xylaria castorea]
MDCHGSQTVDVPTDANGVRGGSSPSPTASYPLLRISEPKSVPTVQTPCHEPYVSESHAPHAHETPLQGPILPEEGASNSNTNPLSEAPQLLPSSPTKHAKWSISDSLGRANVGIIIGGIIASCATVGFIIFLWTGQGSTSDGQHANFAWRSIMLSGRLSQLITLSCVLLRFSIGVQTTICTSLVAALVLERRSIALSRSAPLSILRSVNSGPRILIQQILSEKNSRHLLSHPEVSLLLLLALGNIAMQFSSTILFSDLQVRLLVKSPHTIQTNMLLSNNSQANAVTWSRSPRDFSLFGESYTGYSANPDSLGLSDTGVKRHAMLPFAKSEERTALREYRGPSIVLSSRVACMPPTVSGTVRFSNTTSSGSASYQKFGYMIGKVLYKETFRSAGIVPPGTYDSDKRSSNDIYFDCAVPARYQLEPIVNTICTPNTLEGQFNSSGWHINQDPWTAAATVVLIFSTNLNNDAWESLGNATVQLPQSDVQEEWRSFDFGSDRFINMAVCFKSMNVMLSNVSLITEKDLIEPNIGYNYTTADTTSLRRFYGAEPEIQNLTERGIFTMKEIQDRDDHVYGGTDYYQLPVYQQTTSGIEWADNQLNPNTTLPGCNECAGDFDSSASEYSKMFSDIIATTQRASVALQTIHTMFVQSIHDQVIGYLTVSLPVEIVETIAATAPGRCIGLSVVAVLVLVNLTCIVVITTLYLVYSRYTLVDNFWHVISQAVSEETADILHHSNLSKDNDTSDRLKTTDYQVQLQNLAETGEIKVTKVDSNSNIPRILLWYRRGLQAVRGKK